MYYYAEPRVKVFNAMKVALFYFILFYFLPVYITVVIYAKQVTWCRPVRFRVLV